MSYSEGIIKRYGDAIEDEEQRRQFQERVVGIEFWEDGDRRMCTGRAVRMALTGTEVEHLADDFARRYINFMSPEDFDRY
ncbi:MAG: hypothetical protein AAB848_03090 [Patescibacteria group bacterium]